MTYVSRPAPRSSRLALMIDWLRRNSDTPWTYAIERELVEYRIECRYPGGIAGFDRDRR